MPIHTANAEIVLPSDAEIRQLLIDRIDTQRKSVGMVVGLITPLDRRIISYGALNQGDPRPLSGDSIFDIASVTKVVTSLLLAEMAKRGEVSLTDPVAKYLPADVRIPERKGRSIRLIDLATHTSGLPILPLDYPALNDPAIADYSHEKLYRFLSTYELPHDIGSHWEYSNIDMALLGDALSRRAGIDYETLVRARITDPLGMASTVASVTPHVESRVVVPHDADLRPVPRLGLGAFAPGGCLLSTANDLLTFLAAFLGFVTSPLMPAMSFMLETRRPMRPPIGTLIRKHWKTMLRMILSSRRGGSGPRPVPSEQALGWHVSGRGKDQIVVHDGAGFSAAASVAYDPNARVGIVALSNAGVMVSDITRHLLRPSFPLAPARREIALDLPVLDRYVGDYQSAFGPWTVTREANRLMIQMPRMGMMRLRPESEHDFFTFEFDLQFLFDRDASGRVTRLTIRPRGFFPEMSAVRVDHPPKGALN